MTLDLVRHRAFAGSSGPVVLTVLDGVGIGSGDESDAVSRAQTPTLDRIKDQGLWCALRAHGKAVGLPSDSDMGNSEVGHNALGCGRVHDQGALLVAKSIASGLLFSGAGWTDAMSRCVQGHALHFLGLLSDGNVHSHIDHLLAMLDRAAADGARRAYVHVLLDGRDVPPDSALIYVDRLEAKLSALRQAGVDAAIASGGGRMHITMDRYEADWAMVERGWNTHVHGRGRQFASATEAVKTLRDEQQSPDDQNLGAFVIVADGKPVGAIRDGDAVINFNFRGDRAIEISRAFDGEDFTAFDRSPRPDVLYLGMMEYDGDTHVPRRYLVEPPNIERTMGEYLVHNKVTQLAISETQKFGHVTYFWNGNRSGAFDPTLETYVEVPSDVVPFQERPWMKCAEITDRLVAELRENGPGFTRVNYANGDMVGHTGHLHATIVAVEAVDLQLERLCRAVEQLRGILVITADHGNADEMLQHGKDGSLLRESQTGDPVVKTSHTLNPVPFMIYAPNDHSRLGLDAQRASGAGIASVTATCFELLGFEAPSDLAPSLLRWK